MSRAVRLYSKVYMEQEDNSWSARPTSRLYHTIHQDDEENTARWIAVIEGEHGILYKIALGDPVFDNQTSALYCPPWFLEQAGLHGDGLENIEITFEKAEVLPKATQLTFRLIGQSLPEGFDIRDLLEEPLSQLGVLKEGMIIPVPMMDGLADLHLISCEPSSLVFLDGPEVALLLEDPAAEEAARAAEEARVAQENSLRSQFGQPIVDQGRTHTPIPSPFDSPIGIQGNAGMVAGVNFVPLPSLSSSNTPRNTQGSSNRSSSVQGFIPFQGTGYRLGNA